MANDATRQREITALLKLSEFFSLEELEIVTYDEEATIEQNGVRINILPAWKWLLRLGKLGLEEKSIDKPA